MSHSADEVYEALRAYQRENSYALDALEQRLSEQQQVGLAGIGGDAQRLRAEMDTNMEAIKKKFERMMTKVMGTIQRSTEQINTRESLLQGADGARGGGQETDDLLDDGKSDISDLPSSDTKLEDCLKFTLKPFLGAADYTWAEFLAKFDMCCVFNKVPDASKTALLGFYLGGIPKTYYNEVVALDKGVGYGNLCTKIKGELEASQGTDQAALKISMTRQGESESVKQYYERFRKVVAAGGTPLSDPFVSLHFRMNLRSEIRQNMLTAADKSIDEVVKMVCGVETGQKAIDRVDGSSKKQKAADGMGFDAPTQNENFSKGGKKTKSLGTETASTVEITPTLP